MTKFRTLESRYFQHSIPLVSIDFYDQESHGEDDFSRKQVWFYTYGDEEIEEEFREELTEIFQRLFLEDDLEWSFMTLYPTHVKEEVNHQMKGLFMEISGDTGIPMEQILERTETVAENHSLTGEKSKVVNLEGSLAVTKELEGENIILVDNIVLSGVSMLQGANLLKKHGADKVFAVSLGTDLAHNDKTREVKDGEKASDLLEESQRR